MPLPSTVSPWLHLVTAGIVTAALGKSAQLPVLLLAVTRHEGPQSGIHAVALGDHGRSRRLPAAAPAPAAGRDRLGGAGGRLDRSGDRPASRHGGSGATRPQATARRVDRLADRLRGAGRRQRRCGRRHLSARRARRCQVRPVPRRRGLADRTGHQTAPFPARGRAHPPPGRRLLHRRRRSRWPGCRRCRCGAAKDDVLAAARAESTGLYLVGLAAAAVAAVYSIKALWYVTRPLPEAPRTGYDTERPGTRRVPATSAAPLLVLAGAAAVLGVLALPGPAAWLRDLLGVPGEPSPKAWELGLSATIVLAAAGMSWWRPFRSRALIPPVLVRWADGWLLGERAAHAVVVRPVTAMARALAVFDDRIVDGVVRQVARGGFALAHKARHVDDSGVDTAVEAVGRGGLAAARQARRLDDGGIDAVVSAVASGVRSLGRRARRPQTGLLHQYYAQAAVGFCVLVLIVLLVR